MAAITTRQIALVHVARRDLALDDGTYRALLRRVAYVDSAAELDQAGLDLVLAEVRRLGFKGGQRRPIGGARPGFATDAQLGLIRQLWADYTGGDGTDGQLGRWLERTCGASAARFLAMQEASTAITGLKAMTRRRAGAA